MSSFPYSILALVARVHCGRNSFCYAAVTAEGQPACTSLTWAITRRMAGPGSAEIEPRRFILLGDLIANSCYGLSSYDLPV